MGNSQKPDKKEETGIAPMDEDMPDNEDPHDIEDDDEDLDAEVREVDDEGFEDEREISTINTALDNISEALDKLEEQNDQLNEQLRSILAASRRIKNGMDSVNNFGTSSSSSNPE